MKCESLLWLVGEEGTSPVTECDSVKCESLLWLVGEKGTSPVTECDSVKRESLLGLVGTALPGVPACMQSTAQWIVCGCSQQYSG